MIRACRRLRRLSSRRVDEAEIAEYEVTSKQSFLCRAYCSLTGKTDDTNTRMCPARLSHGANDFM